MSVPLSYWLTRFLKDSAGLERSLTCPVLMIELQSTDDSTTDDWEAGHQFKTVSGIGRPVGSPGEPLTFEVKKQKDNAFQRGVTVGRTSNNDLVVEDPSVSRFHAWFQKDEDQSWSVVDAGSKNGTWIEGKRLKPKKPWPLGAKARIRFGSVDVTFFSAQELIQMLKVRLAR